MGDRELRLEADQLVVFAEKNNHDVLSRIFYDDHHTDRILTQDQYFLIGEKGTGKKIIAQYLSNIRNDKNCTVLDFSTIDFETFSEVDIVKEGALRQGFSIKGDEIMYKKEIKADPFQLHDDIDLTKPNVKRV